MSASGLVWTWERSLAWGVLLALLTATLFGAITFDRSGWPALVGDEATYAMQAASLAWDGDLAYERRDYDRFLEHWGRAPEGLILQSRDDGAHLTHSKPSLYALAVAPFVRLAPVRGAGVANALFLALAAVLAALTLERRVGEAAALWVAVFVWGSVAFVYTFWVHADLFLLCATAAGYALAYRHRPRWEEDLPRVWGGEGGEPPAWRVALRWAVTGALVAVPGAFRPFYLVLLLPPLLAVPRSAWSTARSTEAVGGETLSRGARRLAVGCFLGGALLVLAGSAGVQWAAGGTWSAYAGERRGFYEHTGFPAVDFPASEWSTSVERWGNASWIHPESLDFQWDRRLWAWNGLYFLAGRTVGVLPYFLPLMLALAAFGKGRGRPWIPPLVLVGAATFLLVMPFNFWGGTGAVANRYFLPLYPALWFVAARPMRGFRGLAAATATALAAALFLLPLWRAPRAFLIAEDGRYRHPSAVARAWLPYETTQSHVPGGRDVSHNGLWIKFLDDGARPMAGGTRLTLTGRAATLLVGSAQPLPGLQLEATANLPEGLEVAGAEAGIRAFRPDGSVLHQLQTGEPRAVHPMWWTEEPFHLYRLVLTLPQPPPAPVPFTLRPAAAILVE